ncbi:MAG: YfhO family protein, partial [Eubacterium sp.]|nr:YfhO family protein [Eubacterium sp.]
NYPISRILIFNCYKTPNRMNGGRVYTKFFSNRFVALSMLISLVGMGFMFLVYNVFPFGDTTVLRMDLYHQYGPLFVELFDRVTNHETFLYSWISGGGSSFLGNYFNYLSSPLNIIILLFDRNQMPFAISTIVAIKCMLAAGTFTFYIKKSQKRHSFTSAAFGVLYSFSAYMLAYFWNIMWLDGMIMLPLIILGIEKIINNGKCTLYILSLIYLMYSSYYIGYMMCIFSVFYFLAYFIISYRSSKIDNNFVSSKRFSIQKLYNNKFINRGIKFAVSSIFVGAVCAVFLIPVYKVLSGCSATSDDFPADIKSYFTVLDFLQNHFAALETTIRSSGNDILPNIYCGILTLILVPLFVVQKDSFKRKICLYHTSFNSVCFV